MKIPKKIFSVIIVAIIATSGITSSTQAMYGDGENYRYDEDNLPYILQNHEEHFVVMFEALAKTINQEQYDQNSSRQTKSDIIKMLQRFPTAFIEYMLGKNLDMFQSEQGIQ